MWKWISLWDEAASRVRMGRLLMEVKYHFCGGMIQLPQLGVSSEQPRPLPWPPVLVVLWAGMAGCSHWHL